MAICCCSLAGTAACQHCSNNPFATEVWTNTIVTDKTYAVLPNLYYQQLTEESEPKPEIVECKDCEFYIKHDKRCVVWNHGVHKDDYCSRSQKKEVEE